MPRRFPAGAFTTKLPLYHLATDDADVFTLTNETNVTTITGRRRVHVIAFLYEILEQYPSPHANWILRRVFGHHTLPIIGGWSISTHDSISHEPSRDASSLALSEALAVVTAPTFSLFVIGASSLFIISASSLFIIGASSLLIV